MTTIKDIFFVEPFNLGWIIEKLMRDIAAECEVRGIEVHVGPEEEYSGQQVVLHSRFLYVKRFDSAKINSTFITHIDDIGKEFEVRTLFNQLDSMLCMSPKEAELLVQMGCPPEKVMGIDLPHRGGFINRERICVFSDRYEDQRKNEQWILSYFEGEGAEYCDKFIFTFLGRGWEKFCLDLGKLGVSYEIICYDREMPGEFELQQSILDRMDHMIYLGFDGGAMCVYDGLKANLHLAVTNQSYHIGLPSDTTYFEGQADFFAFMEKLALSMSERETIFAGRSVEAYVTKMLAHWDTLLGVDPQAVAPSIQKTHTESNKDYRKTYSSLTPRRLASSIYRLIKRYFD